ncbi:MAG: hypothetical protein ACRC4N_16085 [Gammaproteobacteria bacterium]
MWIILISEYITMAMIFISSMMAVGYRREFIKRKELESDSERVHVGNRELYKENCELHVTVKSLMNEKGERS